MIATTILNGSIYGIPADLLAAHLRHARKGNRLVVWDPFDDLAPAHFEKGDRRIDMWAGNYDLLADHRHEFECDEAAHEIIGPLVEKSVKDPAIRILSKILYDQARSYGSLEEVAENIRAVGHEQVRKVLATVPSDDAKALKLTWSVMSLLRKHADDIYPPDPHSRMISVADWATCEPSSILFVSNARFSHPISRVLRKKLEKGLGVLSQTAEIIFKAAIDDYNEDPAVQLDLGLPGTKYRELVIDLSDDFDPPPAKQVAEVIAFSKAVETSDNRPSPAAEKPEEDRSTVVPSIEVRDDLDAAVFGITASSPIELAANVLDAPAPCLVGPDDANRRTSVRRKQVMLLTTMTAIMLLLSMQWIFTGDDHYHSHATSAVSEGDFSPGPRSEQEWAAQTDDRLEEGNAQ